MTGIKILVLEVWKERKCKSIPSNDNTILKEINLLLAVL